MRVERKDYKRLRKNIEVLDKKDLSNKIEEFAKVNLKGS